VLAALERSWVGPAKLELQPPRHPLAIGVDADVVERIVAPLLDNAARHAASRVELAAEGHGASIELSVTDDGPGLPAGSEDAVFGPGTRLDPGDGHAGAGLGLALSRRLARAVGGDVRAEPRARGGARFVVSLPR
jgi:signal transduction histidine kinase